MGLYILYPLYLLKGQNCSEPKQPAANWGIHRRPLPFLLLFAECHWFCDLLGVQKKRRQKD